MSRARATAPAPAPAAPTLRRLRPYALALVAYAVAGVYHLRPAVLECTTRTMGPAGDATAGAVWLAWVFEQQGGSPFAARTFLTGAPAGEVLWRSEYWTQTLLYGPVWLATHVTNAICSYNVVMLAGFLASGLAMFALAWWLTRHLFVALLAGYAFAFSPFAQLKAPGHLAYVHQEMFPLILLAGLALAERPTRKRAVGLGLAVGVAGYLDGYYLLFAPLTAATLAVLLLVREGRRGRDRFVVLGRHVAGAAAVAAVVLLPIAASYLATSSAVDGAITRSPDELDTYGADLIDYILPARTSPIFDDVFGDFQDDRLDGSNYSETTLFLGWSTMALAAVAVVATRGRRLAAVAGVRVGAGRPSVLAPRWAAAAPVLVVCAILLAIASGPRLWRIAGLELPGVSYFINLVAPFWRVYARLFIPVHAAVLGAAAVGTVVLLARVRRLVPRMAGLAVLAAIVVVETTASPPLRYSWFDYEATPSGYEWVAAQDDVDIIADYPVWAPRDQPDAAFATYQPVHGKAVVNGKSAGDDGSPLNDVLLGLADAQTVPLLRALDVDLVLVHPGLMPGEPPAEPPPGLQLLRSFRFEEDAATRLSADQARRAAGQADWYDIDVYAIEDGPVADVAVVPGAGFHPAELTGWRAGRWAEVEDPRLEVVAVDEAVTTAHVELSVHSFAEPRRVRFLQDGELLWEGEVGPDDVEVAFEAAPGIVDIEATPRPTAVRDAMPGSDDPRRLSIFVSGFRATGR